jgi:hypothetical protein
MLIMAIPPPFVPRWLSGMLPLQTCIVIGGTTIANERACYEMEIVSNVVEKACIKIQSADTGMESVCIGSTESGYWDGE